MHVVVSMDKLSAHSTQLLNDFARAAKIWGWEEDQGVGDRVEKAHKEFGRTRKALESRIRNLEAKIKKLEVELIEVKFSGLSKG